MNENLSKLVPFCALQVMIPTLFLVGASVASGGGFALRVNDVSGLDEPWPMIGGLPFPEGALSDQSQIRVVDADGQELPTQIDVVATWNDGSVRWAQAGINASPQGEYRVEFGPGVSRSEPATPLRVERDDDGGLSVDTGAAVFEFSADGLLPQTVRMNDTVVVEGSGDGAYLVENRGRLARVAGEAAGIETELLKEGPGRVVVRREGWYVTDEGEPVARAKAWFYLTAGSPYLRVTHTLVFTEDTNELWVRDYGLEFRTSQSVEEAVFAVGEPGPGEERRPGGTRGLDQEDLDELARLHFEELPERELKLFAVPLNGDELYMLQDDYPHLLERNYRAVIARVLADRENGFGRESLWTHEWLRHMDVAGDWAEAVYNDASLTVVVPQLALRFPKEIAISPASVRVAFWSGRSGRELDFRSVTLVNEYWRSWARGAWKAFRNALPEDVTREQRDKLGAAFLSAYPSNAQGAARTHEVWLLPATERADNGAGLRQRALAASHPPLLQADPAWQAATEAIGWPVHPVDVERFEREEEILRGIWESLVSSASYHAGLRRTGFISWGQNMNLHGPFSFFRISRMTDYNLRRNVWNLYARSGDRSYFDYGTRFNQFAGDWEIAHWTAGDKFMGEFADGTDNDLPLHWGSSSNLRGSSLDVTGHTAVNWLLEYYLTGNEYAGEIIKLLAHAYRERGDTEMPRLFTSHIYVLSVLYAHEKDETLRRLLEEQVELLIDLENPTGLSEEESRHGVYYKTHRSLLALYDYYRATGDERARQAFLQGVEDKFNYHLVFDRTDIPGGRGAFGRSYSAFLFSIAYQWTGREAYRQVVNRLHDEFLEWGGETGLLGQMAPLKGAPTAMGVLANVEEPIPGFPVREIEGDGAMVIEKREGAPVEARFYVRTSEKLDKLTPPSVSVRLQGSDGDREIDGVIVGVEQMFQTNDVARWDPRRWHVRLEMPADVPPGRYVVAFRDAQKVVLLETNAPEPALPGLRAR